MDDDLLPLSEEERPDDFDVVLRGYDRRQVNDHIARLEATLHEANSRIADEAARMAAIEQQAVETHERLLDAERRAEGRPEPVPVSGERIATMLRLADEEATALKADAAATADALLTDARQRAGQETAARTAELDRREAALQRAAQESEQATLQAQKDADSIRANAMREAEQIKARAAQEADVAVRKAQEEVGRMREAGQHEAAAMTAEARRQVEELSKERDRMYGELQKIQDALSRTVGPLASVAPPTAGGSGGSVRVEGA
ncbi:MAG: hypothetical protein LC789_07480 [Actinobacteria bacterium]|nr:hypothetical protein [Actinomycetota bacterium]MCA1721675.1 hypothetical protein [Actinomycetota bacterium]